MDPITTAALFGTLKLGQKLFAGKSRAKCQLCEQDITGDSFTTPCCGSTLSAKCVPRWQKLGGARCMFCNAPKS